jgi:hypothetical protein
MITEARHALTGLIKLFRGENDIDLFFADDGLAAARSFIAALIAAPAYVFIVLSSRHLGAEMSWAEAGLTYLGIWALFPALAYVMVAIQGHRDGFRFWLQLHNWAVLFVLYLQALPFVLLISGAFPGELAGLLSGLFQAMIFFLYYRITRAATGAPVMIAIVMTAIHVVANYGMQTAISGEFTKWRETRIEASAEPSEPQR